jgi:hypothetical protein
MVNHLFSLNVVCFAGFADKALRYLGLLGKGFLSLKLLNLIFIDLLVEQVQLLYKITTLNTKFLLFNPLSG